MWPATAARHDFWVCAEISSTNQIDCRKLIRKEQTLHFPEHLTRRSESKVSENGVGLKTAILQPIATNADFPIHAIVTYLDQIRRMKAFRRGLAKIFAASMSKRPICCRLLNATREKITFVVNSCRCIKLHLLSVPLAAVRCCRGLRRL